jgi:hypothetical protein
MVRILTAEMTMGYSDLEPSQLVTEISVNMKQVCGKPQESEPE